MTEVAGIDQSAAVPPAGYYTRAYASGVRIVFFDAYTGGLSTSKPLRAVLATCPQLARNAGHITGLYANVAPWQANGRVAVDGAMMIAGPEFDPKLNPWMMIDCEIGYDPNWKTYMAPFAGYDGWLREQAIQEATDYAQSLGFKVVSYSAAWWINWMALHYGHVPDLLAPVVYARYDGVATIGDPGFSTLGRQVVGKQYGGSTADGTDVDLDTFDSAFFGLGGGDMPLTQSDLDLIGVELDIKLKGIYDHLAAIEAKVNATPAPAGTPPTPRSGTWTTST